MKVSYNWLKELTGVNWSVEDMANRLTLCGTACEEIESMSEHMDRVVVAEVTDVQPIPGADKIRKATVNTGADTFDLVCGAPNVAPGQKVAVAMLGAKLANGMEIKATKIRGIPSSAMICAEDELGLSDDHAGIMVLDPNAVIGTPLADHLGLNDFSMGFELTPNRGDCMSAVGIARDLAALAGVSVRYPEIQLPTTKEKASDVISVASEDIKACPRFTARIIRNVKLGPSPQWMQQRLRASGVRPISNVVDITNYVMLEMGNPVHAFDLDRFGSNQVVVRRARDGEKMVTLDGKEHSLTSDVLLVTNGNEAKGVAGVMGGYDSEVTDQTKNILLEVAYFDPTVIRKSRRCLGMVTEASQRFEKGVDPNNVANASARVAQLFHELCGGEVAEGVVDCYPKPILPPVVPLRPRRCNAILGTSYPAERMAEILSHLGLQVQAGDPMQVTVPTYRPDITREIDLIEEVARIEGHESIPDAIDNIGPLFTPWHEDVRFEDELRKILTGIGYDEMMGHGLADSKMAALLNPELPQVRIIAPVSEDLDIMRNDLTLTALSAVSHNVAHRNVDLKLFEIGCAYFPPDDKGAWVEEDRLLLVVTGKSDADWRMVARELDFYDLSGALDRLAGHFHWLALTFEPKPISYFTSEISFEVRLGGEPVGWIGCIDSEIARRSDIKQPVYLVQIRVDELRKRSTTQVSFKPLPAYPAAPRDLAAVVGAHTRVGDMIDVVKERAGDIAESVEIFDVYAGKQIGAGKKSIGIAIVYRSAERSLSSEEIDERQAQIVADLKRVFNAEIRDK